MMEGGNTLLMVSASDLKEFAMSLIDEVRNQAMEREKKDIFLTESEVCEKLNVTHTTLWRWNKKGYLRSHKMGRRTLWKQSEIELMMEGNNK